MPNPSDDEKNSSERPALTIHIQSWATPVVGLVMLVLGLAAGFWGRPLLDKPGTATPAAPVAQVTTIPATPAAAAAPTVDPTQQARLKELMAYMVSQTRHFRGDANAPVTIIEFSDFQ